MNKQIFCLTAPAPVAVATAGGYAAYEFHSLSSVADRIGAPKTSVHRWISEGHLPAKPVRGGKYAFLSNHLEQFAFRIKCEKHRKFMAAKERTELAAVISDPATASDEALVGAYLKSNGQTASHLWGEVSRRYQANPYVVNGIIGQAIRQNQEAAKTAPAFANVWNKATGRTERARVR